MNVTIGEKLPEIFNLARERSEPSRVKLAGILADIFLSDNALSDREQILINEIIDELVGNTTPQVKQMLSQRLSFSANVPHRVLLNLACDSHPEVAKPILINSARLKDEDLIFVIEARGTDHALSIAERTTISEAVVDAMVATGDVDVMAVVASNLGAKLSQRTLHVMIEAARFGKKLHEPLTNRPELTADMGKQLYWWVGAELRRSIVSRFGITAGQVDQALENSVNDLLTSMETDRNDDLAMQKVAEWFAEREAVTPRAMIQALRMGFFKLFDIMLAMKTGLDVSIIDMMVSEDGGRSVSVLCKAIGVDKPSFVSIFLLSRGARPGEQIVNPKELSSALAAFDKLETATAKTLIDTWKKDPSYLLSRLKQAIH
ncbi:MAG: DUF2336 domain-containing protein [Alphaproteobacteria bacterium]|nr:DUF2336 domain-containing protein [Alphaproteobacteria bacterium]